MKSFVYYLKQISMNPQKLIKSFIIILLSMGVLIACKKDEPVEVPTDSSTIQQLSEDDSSVGYSVDEVIIDAGQIVIGKDGLKDMDLPCNATLESVYTVNDTVNYRIVYNGLNCDNSKHRTGVVIIKMKEGTQWTTAGTFLNFEFHNYLETDALTGHTIKINGESDLENVSGGIIQLLGSETTTVIHKNTANVNVSFKGEPARDWNLTKLLVYTGQPGSLVLAVNGFGTAHGYSNLLSWGKDHEGNSFFSQVAQSIVSTEVCNFLPRSGVKVYSIPSENSKATVTYGFNNSNVQISGSECPTTYRLIWQQYGRSGTIFKPLTRIY
jgi:hypothetical protein